MPEQFDFSTALYRLKSGSRVRRCGWNGKGMSLVLVVATPQVAPYVAILATDGRLYPWNPSQQDLLAEDWEQAD